MFSASLPLWEFWSEGRWPVRGEGVAYPKDEARVIEKEQPAIPYRRNWQVDAVVARLAKAKMEVTARYGWKVLETNEYRIFADPANDAWPFTGVRFAQWVWIEATHKKKQRRKRKAYVKPYTHPLDFPARITCKHGTVGSCNLCRWGV